MYEIIGIVILVLLYNYLLVVGILNSNIVIIFSQNLRWVDN
jgi:hypothetical protein